MQWDDSINAGFNAGKTPWLKVTPNYKQINVKQCIEDKDSILYTYKHLIELRKSNEYRDVIHYGDFKLELPDDPYLFVYEREYNNQKLLVVINFDNAEHEITLNKKPKKILISNYKTSTLNLKKQTLLPYEAIVYEL